VSGDRHPDRVDLDPGLFGAIFVATATTMSVAGVVTSTTNGQPASAGALAGVVVSALAMWGLPSLSLRLVARVALMTSGAAMARFGVVGPVIENGTQTLLLWIAAAVATMVLTARLDHVSVAAAPLVGGGATPAPAPAAPGRTATHVVIVAAVVLAVVTLLAPYAVSRAGGEAAAGAGPTSPPVEGSSPLRTADSLDMTTRPELTDDVVLTVQADTDLFLRGDVYDQWDGRSWERSRRDLFALVGGQEVINPPFDLGVLGADVVEHTVRVEAGYADVFFAAPTALRIESEVLAAQTLEGVLLAPRGAMGRGETYRVTSRRHELTEELLRSVDDGIVPDSVIDSYAETPIATDRVVELADRIVDEAGATTTYDAVRALEGWMDENLEYSIDAPTAPEGVDVVDDFLFRAKLGWCEQIASSLVVMARTQGIPARLATGYVMNERDAVSGTYVVRARDAHAWAEVWFPDVGWVPFDPTAGVPLSPSAPQDETLTDWVLAHIVQLVVGAGVVVVAGLALRRLVRRVLARRRERSRDWATVADDRLTTLGAAAGFDRRPGDTATAFARRVDPSLVAVGEVIDRHRYAPTAPSSDDRAAADVRLDEAERTPGDADPG
jgi:transglutaminase-like putative cysteine protease